MLRIGPEAMLAAVALASAGCTPSVGECDQERALELAYDQDGVPAFAGQALMIEGCGSGGFCHSEGIERAERFGAPHGLDFDVRPASTSTEFTSTEMENAAVARLEEDRLRVLQLRGDIWDQVDEGRMPPSGESGAEYRASVTVSYEIVTNEAGTEFGPLPGLDTEEGRDILRNWLACGAPVVERTVERADREPTANFIVPVCQRDCVDLTWPSIHERIITPGCATARCHDDSDPAAQLDLSGDAMAAYDRIVDAAAVGLQCMSEGTPILTPGDPDASLLLVKVEAPSSEDVCGSKMPLSGSALPQQRLCAIREWIDCGACPEADGGDCAACIREAERLDRCGLVEDAGAVACAEEPACMARASL
jgi:hypothetical protein